MGTFLKTESSILNIIPKPGLDRKDFPLFFIYNVREKNSPICVSGRSLTQDVEKWEKRQKKAGPDGKKDG